MERLEDGFYVVIIDHDRKRYNVIGKIYSDDVYPYRVADAQRKGRNVAYVMAGSDRNRIVEEYRLTLPDYLYADDRLV